MTHRFTKPQKELKYQKKANNDQPLEKSFVPVMPDLQSRNKPSVFFALGYYHSF